MNEKSFKLRDAIFYYSEFTGEFIDDHKHGKGVFKYADGSVYEGDYCLGKKEGFGRQVAANGDVFEGTFSHGKMRCGTSLENGVRYEGEYDNNERNGRGKIEWPNGVKFDGNFMNHHMHEGTLCMTDGSIYKAKFNSKDISGWLHLKLTNNEGTDTEALFFDGVFVESDILQS